MPQLAFRVLPGECESIVDARSIMDKMIAEYKSPTLIYLSSASARFPLVDGFVVYTSGGSATAKNRGLSDKVWGCEATPSY
jgi:hypothetical protein